MVLNSSRRFTSSAVWRLLKEAKGRDIFSVPFSWKNCLATFFVLPFVWSRIEFALILMVLSERYINESGSSTFDSTYCKGELMFLRRRLLQNNSPKRWLKHMETVLTLLRSCLCMVFLKISSVIGKWYGIKQCMYKSAKSRERKSNLFWLAKLILFKSALLPYLTYCHLVWHFCRPRDGRKLQRLQEMGLRAVYRLRQACKLSTIS